MAKSSELKQIRAALNLSQAEMGELFGVKQGVYQRWEVSPDSPTARDATEKAKGIYFERVGRAWAVEAAGGLSGDLTREEFAEWRGYWKGGMEGVLARLEALEDQVRKLSQPGKGG